MREITTKIIFILSTAVFHFINLNAQNVTSPKHSGSWTVKKPFNAEVFIENKGQFDTPDEQLEKNILYGINNGGMKIYFTPSGLSYHVINIVSKLPNKEKETEITEQAEEEMRQYGKIDNTHFRKYYNDKSAYIKMEWVDANPNPEILVSEQVPNHYSYSKKQNGELLPIIANAFKKLTYKNIYPSIDIEFSFEETTDELGVKYNVVVHPGGDISRIKMKYSGMQRISLDSKGDIVVNIPEGNITDHSPSLSYMENGRPVATGFVLNDEIVSFRAATYDKNQTLTIDPFITVWSTNPAFNTSNMGYTIRADYGGNVYVMGGGVLVGGAGPQNWTYQVKKFNSAGVLQWTYTTGNAYLGWYGDMTVLRSGSIFFALGLGDPTIYKLSSSTGTVITSKNTNHEQWRFSYNQSLNNNVIYIGAGSSNGSDLHKTDTTLTSYTIYAPWDSLTNTDDVVCLTQDKSGSYIYSTIEHSNAAKRPSMAKVSTASLGMALWKTADSAPFIEVGQMSFINNGTANPVTRGWSNGMNGMATCNDRIYTYDGRILTARDTSNGMATDSVITGGAFDKHAGIDVDSCCRVYVGYSNEVKRYFSSLAFDASVPVAGEVYDLILDPRNQNILYTTGKGFVQRIDSMGLCNTTTLVNEIESSTYLLISPNPSSGVFNFSSNQYINSEIKIYNIYGELIYHKIITSADKQINLSSQPDGIYFLSLQMNKLAVNKKLIVHK